MEKSIFKAYDIRGLYPKDLNEELAAFIAQAFVNLLSAKLKKKPEDLVITLGRDVRLASEPLAKMAIKVFLNNGVTVEDLGLVSTNDYYFSLGTYSCDAGMMVTASHNPPQYGGFKMAFKENPSGPDFLFISGKELLVEVEKIQTLPELDLKGKLSTRDIFADHLKHVFSFVDIKKIKPLKIVVDAGNGMNAIMAEKIFKQLPCELTPLFFELDKDFPNRPPNPLADGASEKIANKIKEVQADLGVMFDVDGDRMFLVDEQGKLLKGDITLLLLAKIFLAKYPQSAIVYNLICSHAVKELISAWGGRPIRSEVGYMNSARHMREEAAVMSGEVSGHFAFKENFYSDNAFVAMLLALENISVDGRPLSVIAKDFILYFRGDEINITLADIPAALEKIRTQYKANILDELDGITVELADWWFNVRASNTEPLLRITIEANTRELWEEKKTELLTLLS